MRFSFRTKLTFWYTLVLSTLLVVASTFLFVTLQNIAAQKLDATLWLIGATEAEGISARLHDRGISDPDDLTVRDIDIADLPGYEVFHFQRYVTVVSQTRRVADFSTNLASSPLRSNEDLLNRAFEGKINFETVDVAGIGPLRTVYVPVLGRDTKPFVVIVGVPTEFVGAELKSLVLNLIVFIFIFFALAVVSGWFLSRRAMRPIRQTAVAVRGISDRNLHERLPQPDTNDDIDNLVTVFNQLLGRLESSFETQKRFTADASHEIGTPLTALKGQTEVALIQRRTPDEYDALLRSNLDGINRLTQIISNLLVLARADAGEDQVSPEILSLDVLVNEIFASFKPLAETKQIEFLLKIEESAFLIGDQSAIEQIISNLLQNCLRYTPLGGKVSVRVYIDADENACLECVDNGIGISETDLPYIFDRFYRAGNARLVQADGSGLGLAISRLLAESLGGKIDVETEVGKGSRFVFSMPAIIISPDQ